MRIKSSFVLRNVAQTWVILPVGDESTQCKGVLTPNESGAMLWKMLEQGCDIQSLVDALTKEYDVSSHQALADVEAFVEKLRLAGCIEEDS